MLSIRSNIGSLDAQRNLNTSSSLLASSQAKLSSGYRITKAGDDAAGLGIASNLEAQIRSYDQAARNSSDAQSLIQTAEGALNQSTSLLTRLRELAMQSASSGVGTTERGYIQLEAASILTELDRIANSTEYNGTALLNTTALQLTFQVGIRNVAANDQIVVGSIDATAATLGVSTVDLSTQAGAQNALASVDTAIQSISGSRAQFGAASNRFDSVTQTIQIDSEDLSAADARIKDVDVANESSNLARINVLMQAGVSVLAQANQAPQLALKLLQQ
ncbi:MAG: flagellin [Myxococcaceae bacterium]